MLLVNVLVGVVTQKAEVLALGTQTIGESLLTDMCGLSKWFLHSLPLGV